MPDLFDNLFNKIGAKINGGKTTHYHGGASQVNTGRFYSYVATPNNNNYWLPREKQASATAAAMSADDTTINIKERSSSIVSMEESQSRSGSVS
ncbi:uncharacterized protein SPAPADRAFT_60263, partial [Spathaspora passalidarum NRRL Y-27907]